MGYEMSVDTGLIRNFVIAGHSGGGKTSLCDLMLFKSGAVNRLGKVDEESSVSDYTSDEKEKKSSIFATPLNCEWIKNHLYFMDTPGYGEFVGETISSFNASGNTLIVINGVNGLEVGSARAKNLAKRLKLPRFIFVNKLDCDNTDFSSVLSQLQDVYGSNVIVPMTMPVGEGAGFEKVIHILRSKDIPAEMEKEVSQYREQLLDIVAESDEKLMERYLSGEDLSEEEISAGLHDAVHSGSIVPVFAGSVEKDIGVEELMNGIVNLFEPPMSHGKLVLKDDKEIDVYDDGDGLALVFKSVQDPFVGQMTCIRVLSGRFKSDSEVYNLSTGSKERIGSLLLIDGKEQIPIDEVGPGAICAVTKLKDTHIGNTICTSSSGPELHLIDFPEPVMAYAIEAMKKGEEEKVAQGIGRLVECDPTLHFDRHQETGETILSGMGELHIRSSLKKLKDLYKVEVSLSTPKIPYRETITANGEGHFRHKKQSGGHGQFAEVHLRIEPNLGGFEIVNEIVGGSIPKNFIPAVEKGLVEAIESGPLAGCSVENLKVSVYDGKFHAVDSSEMAFKIAARSALHEAMENSKPILLEPIVNVKVTVPGEYMGDVTGGLNHKRGRILGMTMEDGLDVVEADVPLSEMTHFATELRSFTHGRGIFEMSHSRYEAVPPNIANKVISNFKKE